MASNAQSSIPLQPKRFFTPVRLVLLLVMLLMLSVSGALYWFSNDPVTQSPGPSNIVDVHTWTTAQALAAMAPTTEEAQYAREAERLADHEVDQAFALASREADEQATNQSRVSSDKAKAIAQSVEALQQLVKDDQETVRSLTPLGATAPTTPPPADITAVPTELDLAREHLGVDSEHLKELQQDLARESGDERSRIEQELATHEASMRAYDARAKTPVPMADIAEQRAGTLAERVREWKKQQERIQRLAEAERRARGDAEQLKTDQKSLKTKAEAFAAASAGAIKRGPKAEMGNLRARNAQRQLLVIYGDRNQTLQQLADIYSKWRAQVLIEHRVTRRLVMQSLMWIALIIVGVVFFDGLIRHMVDRHTTDRSRLQTLRMVFVFAVQAIGALLILFVVIGLPNETPTMVGLTTAGLTVALQDVIIAFLGWFLLMRKNGIRVGDWVEINGVGGEVVEIGLLRTAMLETGNWTDKGHPTGRRVTFINSFAIKGQYFNFSTTGQWMWDEIALSIPAGDASYQRMELIRQAVLKETEHDAQIAAQEWKTATLHNGLGLSQFKVSPAVDMKPTGSGIEMIVRYVTRATNRFETRHRLYQRVLEALKAPLPASTD